MIGIIAIYLFAFAILIFTAEENRNQALMASCVTRNLVRIAHSCWMSVDDLIEKD